MSGREQKQNRQKELQKHFQKVQVDVSNKKVAIKKEK